MTVYLLSWFRRRKPVVNKHHEPQKPVKLSRETFAKVLAVNCAKLQVK